MHGITPQANNTATMFGIAHSNAFERYHSFHFPKALDQENGTSLPKLIGTHDFIGFSALKTKNRLPND